MTATLHDFLTPDQILRHQMTVHTTLTQFPSGSKSVILTPGQLARLEELTRGSEDPRDEGMRLLLDLDDLPQQAVSAGQ